MGEANSPDFIKIDGAKQEEDQGSSPKNKQHFSYQRTQTKLISEDHEDSSPPQLKNINEAEMSAEELLNRNESAESPNPLTKYGPRQIEDEGELRTEQDSVSQPI